MSKNGVLQIEVLAIVYMQLMSSVFEHRPALAINYSKVPDSFIAQLALTLLWVQQHWKVPERGGYGMHAFGRPLGSSLSKLVFTVKA